MQPAKRSKVEDIKVASAGLRGPVDRELRDPGDHFSEEGYQVLKFHGIYQQDDRDIRRARKAQGLGPDYSFMIRVAIPGGVLSPEQYLELDRLADALGDASLRVTSRQAIQYHGVRKGGLKPLMKILNENLLTTLSACGDVVRNVVCCPAPLADGRREEVTRYARELSTRFKPKTSAYYELWLDGEKAASLEHEEPLYGATYLPRKFKVAFAFPGDNCVDAYTQDVGIVPVYGEGLEGFTVIVGGGLGQSHGAKDTHPRLGDPLTTVPPERLLDVVEAVVKVQRDHGRRDDRKFSRMKYLVEAWGIERFRAEVERVAGFPLPQPQPLEWRSGEDHLGWFEQDDGRLCLGLFVENGRIKGALREALRAAVERFGPEVRLTPQQNAILANVEPADRPALEALLAAHGVTLPEAVPPVVRRSMACPALPTCGLAITEAERIMPDVIREIGAALEAADLQDAPAPYVRMTGCPNGCARPYSAEIGLVGRSLDLYTVYLGGSPVGTRLGEVYLDHVPRAEIASRLQPALERYREHGQPGESFGDFCHRVGLAALGGQAVRVPSSRT